MLEKQRKNITIETIDIYGLEGSLENTIKLLEGMRDEQYEDTRVLIDCSFDGEDGYAELIVTGYRMENDAELEARQDLHNKAELQKYLKEQEAQKKKKELYEQLKQEFES